MAYHFFIQGPLGSGKTFLMSTLAHHWKTKVEKQGGHIELFSNYELYDSRPITHYSDWYDVAKAQGSIVLWDEAHMAFSNRRWSRYGQNILTDVLMFTRKMRSVQIYCAPSIHFVDSRVRSIVEVLINARKIGDKGFVYHFQDYQTGEFLHKQFLPMYKAKQLFKLKLYDTESMVNYFPVPQTEREGEQFFNKLDEIHEQARMQERKRVLI